MSESKKLELKLRYSVKVYNKNALLLYLPMVLELIIFVLICVFIKNNLIIDAVITINFLINIFVMKEPIIEAIRVKNLIKRIASGQSKVEVEKRRIKSFDLGKDCIEDEDGNTFKVEYTTDDEYCFLAGEKAVTLVSVEDKIYAFSVYRF